MNLETKEVERLTCHILVLAITSTLTMIRTTRPTVDESFRPEYQDGRHSAHLS